MAHLPQSGWARRPQIPAEAGTVLDPHTLFRVHPLQTSTVEERQPSRVANRVSMWSVPGPSDLWPSYRQSGWARRPQIPAGARIVLDPHTLFRTHPHKNTRPAERVALLHASSLSGNRRDAGSSPHFIQARRPGTHSIHSLNPPEPP